MIDDQLQREQALDPGKSFIVQAPAGSGKTELLIQRFLKLLSCVDEPESIVAITFTKKAAGEMRARIFEALRHPAKLEVTVQLAKAALARDAAAGWRLLENPARLRIQTIDSLCASITRQMPWLSRFGAPPQITEKAQSLYLEAARNTLRMVADEERDGHHGPLSKFLLHLDNNFNQAERLIARMLERRDQWLRHTGSGSGPDLEAVRRELEGSLTLVVERQLESLRAAFPAVDKYQLPPDREQWLALADVLLTKDGKPRKKAPSDPPLAYLSALLHRNHSLAERLKEVRKLPGDGFSDSQWQITETLFDVLPKAVAHLQLVFRERGRVDFVELSIVASRALGRLEDPTDLALSLGHHIDHLLLDEFQDTSYTQYDLLSKLTAGWQARDGHTLFLVGDPMQSIYRFREADVALFLKARREGIGSVPLTPLTLTVNFRSDPAIVNWINQTFSAILPAEEDIDRGAVSYSPSTASRSASGLSARPVIHAFLGESRRQETERIVDLIREARGSIAVLVRARSHLSVLIPALRAHNIPFQAIEIDSLQDRAIIQDLLALTFAILHLADRVSWLAILRAPWCGLTLQDLTSLAGEHHKTTIWDLLHRPGLALSPDAEVRLARCLPVLARAIERRGRVALRRLVEETWLGLGGPACVLQDSELADAAAYFDLLESLEEAGDLADFKLLRQQVEDLFAQPHAAADGRLQIMTIHKAKGLEFENVILPGLDQPPRRDDDDLLVWLEMEGRLLLAPKSATGEEDDPIYKYLTHLEREKTRQENARLLYVAATRARQRLHLLACASWNEKKQEPAATSGTFLHLLWPQVATEFAGAAHATAANSQTAAPLRMLRRLPANWILPAPPLAVEWTRETPVRADDPAITYEWVGDTQRHVGTVVHAFLQRIASEGVDEWSPQRVNSCRRTIATMLQNKGVPPLELDDARVRVEKCLLHAVQSEQGRWILGNHAGAASEYAITGLLDGKLQQRAIDRTFIDEQGVRWIIDIKTSSHEGGKLDQFLDQERHRYSEKLELYARMLSQTEERPIRLALYFPLLNAWREWPAPEIKRRQASLFE